MKIPTAPPAALPGYLGPYISLLPPNARLLVQAGGGDGVLARAYKRIYPAAQWHCVEADAASADQARRYADAVIQAGLDTAGESLYRHLRWADAWTFDCTLETLRAPQRVLDGIRKVIELDACIVARIANRQGHAPGYAPEQILELLQQTGFRAATAVELFHAPAEAATHFLIQAVPAS